MVWAALDDIKVSGNQKDVLIEMTFMMIRGHTRLWTNRFSTVRSIDHLSSRRNIDVGVLICLARRKANSSNPRFGGDEFARLNYHKKAGCVSVHVGICATIEMPAFFAAFNYSDALGRLNRLLVSLVKRNYEWRLRNSGITASLGRGRVTDQLRVFLRQFLLECYRSVGRPKPILHGSFSMIVTPKVNTLDEDFFFGAHR